jgi:uncharacterized membrane protein
MNGIKKNTFYLFIGFIAITLLAIFWYSIEIRNSLVIVIAVIAGIAAIYLARLKVTDLIEDERSAKITEKAALRTLQVFWVIFCAFSIGAATERLYVPSFPRPYPPEHPPDILPPRLMGYIQLGMLCLIIFLYVGFRIYYARKYGEWENDDE